MTRFTRCGLLAMFSAAFFAGAASSACAYGEADPSYKPAQIAGVRCQGELAALGDGRVFASIFTDLFSWGAGKFRADGSVDADWGEAGAALIGPSRGYQVPRALLPTADGGLYLVADFIVRLTPGGRLDTSYGDGGFSDYISGATMQVPTSAALGADGGVVVFGYDEGELRGRAYFTRFDRFGRRDRSFGTNGFVMFPIDLSQRIYAWAVTSAGGIEVGAYQMGTNGIPVPAVHRYPGTFDTLPLENQLMPRNGAANWISPLAKVDPNGRLLIADWASGPAVSVTRFAVDGKLEGQVKLLARDFDMGPRSVNIEYPKALLAAPGGGWTVLVQAEFYAGFAGVLETGTRAFRLRGDGSLDPSFAQAVKLGEERFASYAQMDDGRFMHTVPSARACSVSRRMGDVPRAETQVVEYYHAGTDHYFMTLDGPESSTLDGNPATGWVRTGQTFGAWGLVDLPGASPVCRFHGDWQAGPESHFYTSQKTECDGLRAAAAASPLGTRAWRLEGINFVVTDSPDGACAPNLTPVYRAYNRGAARGIDPSHRYTTDPAIYATMLNQGWIGEGVRFCAPPVSSRSSAT